MTVVRRDHQQQRGAHMAAFVNGIVHELAPYPVVEYRERG
jgi:hypothetical protein